MGTHEEYKEISDRVLSEHNPDLCNKVKGYWADDYGVGKENAQSQCFSDYAIAYNSLDNCRKSNKSPLNRCLIHMSSYNSDYNLCFEMNFRFGSKEDCLDNFKDKIRSDERLAFCNHYVYPGLGGCFHYAGDSEASVEFCNGINNKDSLVKVQCIMWIAIALDDISLCELATNSISNMISECRSSFHSSHGNVENCLKAISETKENRRSGQEIKCYYQSALVMENPSLCENIESLNNKNNCLVEISQGFNTPSGFSETRLFFIKH